MRRIAAGDVLHIFFASRKGTVPVRMRPPLFFCLVKRKVAAAAVEKKSAINQTCTPCKFGETGSVRTAVQMKQCVLNHGRGTHLA